MAASIFVKKDDTAPHVKASLLDAAGNSVNIAGATVRFIMARKDDHSQVVVDAAASNKQVNDGSDGSKGKVEYAWLAADTATSGSYVCEFEVAYSDGSVQTFPTKAYIEAMITDDLGGTT